MIGCPLCQPNSEARMKNKAIFLAGPTAGGKSGLAMALAQRNNGVIINADSMQVYQELRTVTARPSVEDEASVPHRLYGVMSGASACSAATWADAAKSAIEDCWNSGQLPVVVGGTGLYFRTLLEGISPVPDIPDAIRATVRDRLDNEGSEPLHDELREKDPVLAARLAPRDRQRIARALEVVMATGRPLSDWQREPNQGGLLDNPDVDTVNLVLMPDRDELYTRCDHRLDIMMQESNGLKEIEDLLALHLDPSLPLMKALGVPEFARFYAGEISFDDALMLSKTTTRQYAKRQMTWMRNQFKDWTLGSSQFLESFISSNCNFIKI